MLTSQYAHTLTPSCIWFPGPEPVVSGGRTMQLAIEAYRSVVCTTRAIFEDEELGS